MQYLIILISTLVALLSPHGNHSLFISSASTVIHEERALFDNDPYKAKTAAFVTAVSYRESTFNFQAKSKTNDYCAMQINGRPDLAEKPEECIRVGMTMLRESMRMCPDFPLAFYASGPKGCTDARAQRISNDRLALARWILGKVRSSDQ